MPGTGQKRLTDPNSCPGNHNRALSHGESVSVRGWKKPYINYLGTKEMHTCVTWEVVPIYTCNNPHLSS